ncbi:unnamed protein product, partial [Ectocarpus sp. 12 AP-2014]
YLRGREISCRRSTRPAATRCGRFAATCEWPFGQVLCKGWRVCAGQASCLPAPSVARPPSEMPPLRGNVHGDESVQATCSLVTATPSLLGGYAG